uniref:ADP/ATP translocase n=1 Tax=Romanomermis culicivorax TaxID=13658 RepID=A0A915IHE1_ROMCU
MCATVVVQPLDLVKNRMQLSGVGGKASEYKNSLHCLKSIIRNEGFTAIYNGIQNMRYIDGKPEYRNAL